MTRRTWIQPVLVRRALVIGTIALWTVIVAPFPRSLDGAGMPMTLLLAALDVVLGAMTGWLAFARTGSLDERQAALRDRAYRIAFRLIVLGVIVMVVSGAVGSTTADQSIRAPQEIQVFGSRWIVGLVELLAALPTVVIAWMLPNPVEEAGPGSASSATMRPWLPLAALPALAGLWLLAIGVLPVRATTVTDDVNRGSMPSATCRHYAISREVAGGFGAEARLDVNPCWDGSHAFDYPGDGRSGEERCSVLPGSADFARLADLTCTRRTDSTGTIHYTMSATVEAGLVPAMRRAVTMEIDVSKDGKVLTFG